MGQNRNVEAAVVEMSVVGGSALERMANIFYTTGRYQMLVGLWPLDNSEPATGMYRQRLVKIKYGGLHLRLCVLFAGLRTGEQSRRRCEWIVIGLFTNLMYCI